MNPFGLRVDSLLSFLLEVQAEGFRRCGQRVSFGGVVPTTNSESPLSPSSTMRGTQTISAIGGAMSTIATRGSLATLDSAIGNVGALASASAPRLLYTAHSAFRASDQTSASSSRLDSVKMLRLGGQRRGFSSTGVSLGGLPSRVLGSLVLDHLLTSWPSGSLPSQKPLLRKRRKLLDLGKRARSRVYQREHR